MKKEVIVRIVIDTEGDEFFIDQKHKGFDETKPQQNALLISKLIDVASRQWSSEFEK